MAMSVQLRPQNRDLGMVMREVDEDLAIFLGMRNADNQMIDHFLVDASLDFDASKGAKNESQTETLPSMVDDNLLGLEIETSDYSWLLPQPDSSLLPPVETEKQDSTENQTKISDSEAIISSKSELENTCPEESAPMSDTSSASAIKKPLPSKDKKPIFPAKSKPSSRASTPTSRATLSSSSSTTKPTISSTPTRPISRSSTPSSRPSIPIISKSGPRSSTPTARKPTSAPALDRSSSGRKTGPTITKTASKPSEMISSSKNPKVSSMPAKRPVSASRGTRSSSSSSNEKPRQKSCSPPKVRASVIRSGYKTGNKILSRSSNGGDNDDVNPVLMGTKMVDRVVNMRKLAPPKQDEYAVSNDNNNNRKSSQENSGFGRSLSKKSLDMAIRHMDIRRSIPDKLRPIAIRSGCAKSSNTSDLSESPLSSNCDSSKSSI